jgi:hypothetical protein
VLLGLNSNALNEDNYSIMKINPKLLKKRTIGI